MTELAVVSSEDLVVAPMSPTDLKKQVQLIQQVMRAVMKKDEHYGTIPGTNRAVLYKSGAEKLSMTFHLRPRYKIEITDMGGDHRNYDITCEILGPDGRFQGEGLGCCSTMESKYRWRSGDRECPKCGANAVIRGKKEYGGGWLCWAKKDGCGAKFKADDATITAQEVNIENNPADFYNTCLKMSKKRAFVDAILTATAASDLFTQDFGEDPPAEEAEGRVGTRPDPPPAPRKEKSPHAIFSEALNDIYNEVGRTFKSQDIATAAIQGIIQKHGYERSSQVPGDDQKLLDTILAEVRAHTKELIASKQDPSPPDTETSQTTAVSTSSEKVDGENLLAKLRQEILDIEAKLPELLVEELRKKHNIKDLDAIDDDMVLDSYYAEIEKK